MLVCRCHCPMFLHSLQRKVFAFGLVMMVMGLFLQIHFLFSTPTLIRYLGGPVYWLCWRTVDYINICTPLSQQCFITALFPRELSEMERERCALLCLQIYRCFSDLFLKNFVSNFKQNRSKMKFYGQKLGKE